MHFLFEGSFRRPRMIFSFFSSSLILLDMFPLHSSPLFSSLDNKFQNKNNHIRTHWHTHTQRRTQYKTRNLNWLNPTRIRSRNRNIRPQTADYKQVKSEIELEPRNGGFHRDLLKLSWSLGDLRRKRSPPRSLSTLIFPERRGC